MMCVKHWEETFVVNPATPQQKIIFLMSPPLKKSVNILNIKRKRGSNIQNTHMAQTHSTMVDITKEKIRKPT